MNIDDVTVESFDTTSPASLTHGSVRGLQSTFRFTCDEGGCLNTYGCDTAYCAESQQLACPTATCQEGCTADCTSGPRPSWDQTCPVTCDYGYGCESGAPNCPA